MPGKSPAQWVYAPVLLLVIASLGACGLGHWTSDNLAAPSIVGLPIVTNQPQLKVTGTRLAGMEVWARYGDGRNQRLADAADDTAWAGNLSLAEGSNAFVLYGYQPQSRTAQSATQQVILDTTPPARPQVTAPTAVYLGSDATRPLTLSGSKAPDVSIALGTQTVSDANGSLTWDANVIIQYGPNAFEVHAIDAAGNSSTTALVVYGSHVPAPSIEPRSNCFSSTDKMVRGSKDTNSTLFIVFDNSAPQQVAGPGTTLWSALVQGGDGPHTLEVYATLANEPYQSAVTHLDIVLNTATPAQPVLTAPASPVADTGSATLPLSGTLAAGTYLCVSRAAPGQMGDACLPLATSASGTAAVPSAGAGGTYTYFVRLQNALEGGGANTFYLTARDACGNISAATTRRVYRVAPPQLSDFLPAEGARQSSANLTASVTARGNSNDAGHASAAIAHVEFALDAGMPENATASGDVYSAPFDLSAAAPQTLHTLSATATNSAGLSASLTVHFVYDNGAPVWLSNASQSMPAVNAALAVDDANTLHAVWLDYCAQDGTNCRAPKGPTQQPPDIFYAKRAPDGTWTAPANVSVQDSNDGLAGPPALAVDAAGVVHVAWPETGPVGGKTGGTYGIVYRRLDTTGVWSAPQAVAAPQNGVADTNPVLGVDRLSGSVHLAFTRQSSASRYDILYAKSNQGSFGAPVYVTPVQDANVGIADRPSLAWCGTHALITWQECRKDPIDTSIDHCSNALDHDIYMRPVEANNALGGLQLVSNQNKALHYDGDSLQPKVVCDANQNTWIVWSDDSRLAGQNRRNIWLRQSDATLTFAPYTLVSDSTSAQLAADEPSVTWANVAGSATLAVSWTQALAGGNSDIWGKWVVLSAGFSAAAVQPFVQTAEASFGSQIAVTHDGLPILVWNDLTSLSGSPDGVENLFALGLNISP